MIGVNIQGVLAIIWDIGKILGFLMSNSCLIWQHRII
jgi:hypothetical protein